MERCKYERLKDPMWEHFFPIEYGNKTSVQSKKCLYIQCVKVCRMKTHHENYKDGPQGSIPTLQQSSPGLSSHKRHATEPASQAP